MHPLILGAGLLAAALATPVAQATGTATPRAGGSACPAAGAAVAEQFIPAACAGCWAADVPAPGDAWRLDWIVPGADDAPLAAAALPDATERLLRLGAAPAADAALARTQPARTLPGLRLRVGAGPAWQGYVGLQFTLQLRQRAALPAGATGWLALVEALPAGAEVNEGPRVLVRSVAGPLPLDGADAGRGVSLLRALRWPTGAKPERLQARAWIEAPDGRLLALAGNRCP